MCGPVYGDEHEQAIQAVQPGHGPGIPRTRQIPVGEVTFTILFSSFGSGG